MIYYAYNRKTSLRWKILVATHQKWLTRDARVGTLAKEVDLFNMTQSSLTFLPYAVTNISSKLDRTR